MSDEEFDKKVEEIENNIKESIIITYYFALLYIQVYLNSHKNIST